MKIGQYICRTIKGTIQNPLRCIALAGIAFGLAANWLLFQLVDLARLHPETYAPLLDHALLALVSLLGLIIATFLGFRNIAATLPGGATISVQSETTIKREGDASE